MNDECTFIYRKMVKLSMTFTEKLDTLHQNLMSEYMAYKKGDISQKEYLYRAKPIDCEIEKIEMFTLQGRAALRGSSLLHFQMQVPWKASVYKPGSLHHPLRFYWYSNPNSY